MYIYSIYIQGALSARIRSRSLVLAESRGGVFCAKACMRTYWRRRAYFKRPTKFQATSLAHEIP